MLVFCIVFVVFCVCVWGRLEALVGTIVCHSRPRIVLCPTFLLDDLTSMQYGTSHL